MAVSEGLVWSGTDLNDGTNFTLRGVDFTPPAKRGEWVQGADADGAALVRDPLVDNRTVSLRIRVNPAGTLTMDQALAKVGALVDLCEEAERQADGNALVWTPAQGTKSYTLYVLSGEVTSFPIEKSTQNSGYFQKAPMVELKLTCKPFGYGAEVVAAATVTNTSPVQTLTVGSVTGDVPAEARLIVTDAATQSRRHVEWGLEQRYYAAGVPRIFDQYATDTITAGNYTFDASTSATLAVTGGVLVPSSTAEKRLHRNDTGTTSYTDTDNTVKVTTGASVASGSTGIYARRIDASNFLHANLNFAGAASTLTIVKRVATVDTTLATSSTFTPATATAYWLKFTLQGTALTVAYYTADPNGGGAASTSVTATLSTADAATFASGASGIRLIPQATDYRWDDFKINPLAGYTGLLLSAAPQLVTTGFGGAGTTRTGAYSLDGSGNTVIRTTLTTSALACAGLGNLSHVGTYRVKARVYPVIGTTTATDLKVRLSWKEGDGPLRSNDYTTCVAGTAAFSEVDLGIVSIPEKTLGTQRWTGQIEAYSTTAGDTLDIDYVVLVPAEGYGKARAPFAFLTPTALSARDEFDQTAGNLGTPKALPVGGNWATSGDATDFAVETTGHSAQRATVSDATVNMSRLAIAGTTTFTGVVVQVDAKRSAGSTPTVYQGLLARYTDANNYVSCLLHPIESSVSSTSTMSLAAVVAGVAVVNRTVVIPSPTVGVYYSIRLLVTAEGDVKATYFPAGSSPSGWTIEASASALATGGGIASGKVGFTDASNNASACTRNYDNFWAASYTADAVAFSGRLAEVRSDSAVRQDSTGTYYGPINSYRGARFYLPPAGSQSRTSRVLVKARRNDIDVSQDDQIADSTTATVNYTPRYHVIPR